MQYIGLFIAIYMLLGIFEGRRMVKDIEQWSDEEREELFKDFPIGDLEAIFDKRTYYLLFALLGVPFWIFNKVEDIRDSFRK